MKKTIANVYSGSSTYRELSSVMGYLSTRFRVERSGPFDPLGHNIFIWTPDRFEKWDGSYYNEGLITPYKPWPKEFYLPDTEAIV